jgi:hypothetical protein
VVGNGDPEFRRLPDLKRDEQVLIDLAGVTQASVPEDPKRRVGRAS